MKRNLCILLLLFAFLMVVASAGTAEGNSAEKITLNQILLKYENEKVVLSDRLQIVQNNVNFREIPGGKVLGRLQGGEILICLDEVQYKDNLWYHARSDQYGDGYVVCTYAKPVWNNQNWWPLSETEDVFSENMVLFAYWMGTYQLDHGLSIIETVNNDRQLSVAPFSVRGNMTIVPEDTNIQLVSKLFEYGLVCRNSEYDRLQDQSVSFEEKDEIASAILVKHYGTDDIWKITLGTSVILFIHVNDLHVLPEAPTSARDQKLESELINRLVSEH